MFVGLKLRRNAKKPANVLSEGVAANAGKQYSFFVRN